jgi:hypothetical protein
MSRYTPMAGPTWKHHGQPLLRPQSPDLLPAPGFMGWNRQNVFKARARALCQIHKSN